MAPTSSIGNLSPGQVISGSYTIIGTASDGWALDKVQVSVDGGQTWREAIVAGSSWSFAWQPSATGEHTVLSRATDSAGNVNRRERV